MTESLTLLHVHGPNASSIGYGRLGVKLYDALGKLGVDLYNALPDPNPRNTLNDNERVGRTNVACWVSTPSHAAGWLEGQKPCLFTMWEATRLPESFRETLHEFDTLIVPSMQNVELFSQYHDNVKYVPLAIDVDDWRFQPRDPPERQFRFLIGGSGPRKGVDLAVAAFKKVFGDWAGPGPQPVLVLKNPRGEDYFGERIEMIAGKISAQEEIDLYASSHVYLQPSRGEGFGLQPLQAIASGLPTILTNAHGHEAFAEYGMGLGYDLGPADYFSHGFAGDWWEPRFDELCELMRDCYHHYDQAVVDAEEASVAVREKFTWANTANQFLDALGRERLTAYDGSGQWVKSTAKLYPAKAVRKWRGDVAGATYMFEEGETFLVPADVFRIMYQTRVLHPDCLDVVDTGVMPVDVNELDEYRRRFMYCPTCTQKLGSGVTKADELFAEMEAAQ